jgi:hypothetical protein
VNATERLNVLRFNAKAKVFYLSISMISRQLVVDRISGVARRRSVSGACFS